MPNPYFHFKQFTIYHDKCAMKVGTDGVLLGAWVSVENTEAILDIGTGTGLNSIMLAQRCSARIDALEIDHEACLQAEENIRNCPWSERINLIESSVQDYSRLTREKYDLIISNPPFFQDSFLPGNRSRAIARHHESLPPADLVRCAASMITDRGRFAVIIPYSSLESYTRLLNEHTLYVNDLVYIRPNPVREIIRVMMMTSFERRSLTVKSIAIDTGKHHEHTREYIELTREFYLAF